MFRVLDEPRNPILVVIAGPNGSGKSALTEQLVHVDWFESDAYINPDNIAQTMPGGWRNPNNFRPAAEYAQDLRYQRLREAKDIVFETVLSSPEKLEFLAQAHDRGYFVHLIYVCTFDPTINAARVCQRVMQMGHDVPIEKIISRYYRSVSFAADSLPLVDVAHLFDNSVPSATPALVAHLEDETLSVCSNPPEWMAYIRDQSALNDLVVQELQLVGIEESLSSTSPWLTLPH